MHVCCKDTKRSSLLEVGQAQWFHDTETNLLREGRISFRKSEQSLGKDVKLIEKVGHSKALKIFALFSAYIANRAKKFRTFM